MSIDITMRVDGLKELDNLLAKLPQNVENRILQKSVTGALKEAFADIQRHAPKHLTDEQSKNSRQYGSILANLRLVTAKGARGMRSSRIDTGKAFWGYFIEKGTAHQPAQPWFDPAFRGAVGKVLAKLETLLDKGITDEFKKLEK
jgi:HK97 gp10 family phage protein